MIGGFLFAETSPAAQGTAASSQPVTGSTSAGIATPLDDWEGVNCICECNNTSGGALDVYVQQSPDAGNNWYDVIHFTQFATGAGFKAYAAPLSLATTTATSILIGKNLAPALVASATAGVVNGAWGDRLRLVMVAGTGTTSGVAVTVRIAPQRVRTNQM